MIRGALEILAVGIVVVVLIIIIPNLAVISAGLAVFGAIFVQWVTLLLYGSLLLGGCAAIIAAYVVIDKRRELRLRQQDGAYALMRVKINGAWVVVDPNKMVSSGGVFSEYVGWQELLPAAGWEIASRQSAAVQMTRTAQAIAPGDNAIIGMDRYRPPTIPAAAVNPRAIPAQLRAEMEPPPDDIEVPRLPAPVIAPQQLIDRNQPTRLALGQDVETGDAVYLELKHFPFVRVHGRTQSGKTALARFLVLQAIKHGYEVVIYDPRGGKDWGIFRNHASVVDVSEPQTFIRHLDVEVKRYRERDTLLGQHNASNLEALAQKTGQAYRRRLIVIEELGNINIAAAEIDRDLAKEMGASLSRLTSEAGATGIGGLYLDQMPEKWPGRVRYNSEPIIFNLPKHGGQMAGYYAAHELPKYHCWYDDRIIRTGHMAQDEIIDALAVRSVDDYTPMEPYFDALPPERSENEQPNGDSPHLNPAEVKAAIFAHLDANPDATQAEIRNKLGSSRAWTNACWHEWHNQDEDEE